MAGIRQINYFNIGLFVLLGLFLIVSAIIIFGSKVLFKQVIYTETYFSESVQGLSKGSPVKYLGMDIGEVNDITTVDNIYNFSHNNLSGGGTRYIYVKMAISPRFFHTTGGKTLGNEIEHDVQKGLRVKLALQGLTGNAYLELDFVDPRSNPALAVSWKPENYYIPSTTSTLAYFSDNVQYLFKELRSIGIKKLFDSIKQLVNTADQTTIHVDKAISGIDRQMSETMVGIRALSQNLRALSERAKMYPSSVLFSKPPKRVDFNKIGNR